MRFRPADVMKLDFQGVLTPLIPGFVSFQPGWDMRIPVLTVTAGLTSGSRRAGDTKIAAIKLRGSALKQCSRMNSQVAGWRTGTGSSQKYRPIDVRIVSAHNDGNPFVAEAAAITRAVAVTRAAAQEL
jgi:hypothetical protein